MVRTVLRAVGLLSHLPTLQTYYHVLNRAVWSRLEAGRMLFMQFTLLRVWVATFAPEGPRVVAIDETTPRRQRDHDHGGRHLP